MVEVIGVREQDDTFDKMLAVKLALDEINAQYPDVIIKYFGDDVYEPEEYIRENLQHIPLIGFENSISDWATTIPYTEIDVDDDPDTFEIKLSDIPKDIKRLCIRYTY